MPESIVLCCKIFRARPGKYLSITEIFIQEIDNYNITFEEAARDLGANYFQVIRKVLIPLIKSSIIGGILVAFALSFDEFIVTFFVIGGGHNTIPMLIFSMLRRGVRPSINAVSTIVLIVSFLMISISNRFSKIKASI